MECHWPLAARPRGLQAGQSIRVFADWRHRAQPRTDHDGNESDGQGTFAERGSEGALLRVGRDRTRAEVSIWHAASASRAAAARTFTM